MKIEIVEFYPEKGRSKRTKSLIGTLHVYLIDHKVDLRGVSVFKRKEAWMFRLPSKEGIDPETGKVVKYPVYVPAEKATHDSLMQEIRKKGMEYINRNFFKKGQPK